MLPHFQGHVQALLYMRRLNGVTTDVIQVQHTMAYFLSQNLFKFKWFPQLHCHCRAMPRSRSRSHHGGMRAQKYILIIYDEQAVGVDHDPSVHISRIAVGCVVIR
jgi:hypothetical protein